MESGPANAMMGSMEEGPFQSPTDISGSSMASFTQEIRELAERQGERQDLTWQPLARKSKAHTTASMHSYSKAEKDLDYVLPPRQKADHLLETYWKLVHVAYPFLDREDVTARYHRLWTGENLGNDAATFLCLLNAMFGVASLMDPLKAPEERLAHGRVFYQRAGSMDIELVQVRSLLTVQCFLLLSHYAYTPQACWMYVGLAIRAAQSLGLDLPSTSAQVEDAQRRNLLRRVWHGCVVMDRTLSMIYGQPTVIRSSTIGNVPHPTPHPDESVYTCCKEGSQLREQPESEYHFFIESIKLFELVEEFLSTSRHSEVAISDNEDPNAAIFRRAGAHAVESTLQAEGHLWLWNRNLPTHLQKHSKSEKSATHSRQSNHLWVRSRHFRMLLFRPVLLRVCARRDSQHCKELEGTLLWDLAFRGSVTCVETAMEIINFFRSIAQERTPSELDSLLPAWWYNGFYIYSAAWVVVAATLQPAIVEALTKPKLFSAYNAALAVLHGLELLDPSVKRYIAALKFIFERTTRRDQPNQSLSRQSSIAREIDNSQTPMSSTLVEQPLSGGENDISSLMNGGADPTGSAYLFTSLEAENASFACLQQGWPEAFSRDFSLGVAFDLPDVDFDSSFMWPRSSG